MGNGSGEGRGKLLQKFPAPSRFSLSLLNCLHLKNLIYILKNTRKNAQCGTYLFDEILFCLKKLSRSEKIVSVDPKPLKSCTLHRNIHNPKISRSTRVRPAPAKHVAEETPQPVQPIQNISGASWEELANEVASCRKCRLCESRKNTVFVYGPHNAKLIFICEGPGADEDAQGLPFVGRAGELLTRMIAAMRFDRWKEVYIANIVKCRPPGTASPPEDEANVCKSYLLRQIELVSPQR